MTFMLSLASCLLSIFTWTFSNETHIWQQITPRLTISSIKTNGSYQEMLRLCAANALVNHGETFQPITQETLQALDSLHLFSHIIPKLAHTNLHHGYFVFAKNICQISSQLPELQHRQNIIAYLQQNPELVEKLQTILQSIQHAEASFLWDFFPQAHDSTNNYETNSIIERLVKMYEQVRKTIESNRFLSEKWQRTKQIATISAWIGVGALIYYFNHICERERAYYHDTLMLFGPNVAGIVNKPGVSTALGASTLIVTAAQTINLSFTMKQDFDDVFRKQITLIRMRQLINATEAIDKLLIQHPILQDLLPEHAVIREFSKYRNATAAHNPKMQQFLTLLHSSSFIGNPSYYISFQGKIIQTYGLFSEVKTTFIRLWQALGELDSHLCINQLLQQQHGQYCCPTWIDSTEPVLHLTNYWHPMINYSNAVTNSLYLGASQTAHNVIVTGANAGGKTTALTAIMIAQILAQSIGISPAQQHKATPFARLHTYLDITTNLEAQESLFMAQANRAEKLYHSVHSCNPNEKSLTILDEIFTGTRADFAEKASYEFADNLGSMPHSICLLATHFPKLTELEQNGNFINYHAANATINPNGTLSYPYQIIPGISSQNIAEHILKHKGLLKS